MLVKLEKTSYIVLTILIAALLYSCASIGRPTGGNKDIDPPVFTGSNPAPNSTNVKNQSIVLHFNEYIVLKDQSTKVVVSPAQKENPSIRANGKRINIELRDTLIPNTTYSIDFSDAIQDNNENNPLQGFSFAFATGDTIDTLQISGIVLNARDLEPQKEFFVGVHSCLDDSAFSKLPLERIARTNELGQFTIRNIKPGRYHIFALNDADRNYKFARSEDLAFLEEIIVPSVTEIETMDTVFTSQMVTDTIYKATHSLFLPNDILLSSFNEDYKSLYLVNNERTSDRRFNVLFSAPSDSLPTLEVLKPEGFDNSKKWYILDNSQHNDTLNYWITDTMLIKSDSIRVNMRYLHTDTNDMRTFTNDTIYFNLKKMKKKGNKKVEKKKEEEGKDSLDSIPQIQLLKFAAASSGTIDVYAPFRFKSEEPIDSINPAMIHLKQKIDTIWEDRGIVELKRDSASSILNYKVEYDWEPGGTYGITIDSLAITGIYGLYNGTISQEFKVKELEEYSNLFFKVNVTDSAFVELLDKSDKVVRTAPVENGMADLFNINPGEYYARIVLDANGNGKWDTGNYSQHLQPEEVYYFSKKLNLKQNWDIEETWDIYELPIDVQKPMAIKKNKPKNYREQTKPEDEEEEEEEFGTNFNNMNSYTGNKYNDTRNRTNGFNRR
ncbi:MAG: Ig-like domain-containing protein [Muribaculaceae bacterium]|nr:Ig-like domain-containing protein [Muribaculaceae bacterium]